MIKKRHKKKSERLEPRGLKVPSYSAFHKTFDRRFAKFAVNSISLPRTWEFQCATVNQIVNFETNLGILRPTSWECGEVISPMLLVVVLK